MPSETKLNYIYGCFAITALILIAINILAGIALSILNRLTHFYGDGDIDFFNYFVPGVRELFQVISLCICCVILYQKIKSNRFEKDLANRKLILGVQLYCISKAVTVVCIAIVNVTFKTVLNTYLVASCSILMYTLLLTTMIICALLFYHFPLELKFKSVVNRQGQLYIVAIQTNE